MVILPWSVNVCNVKWLDEVLLDNKYILVIPCLKSFEHSPTKFNFNSSMTLSKKKLDYTNII